MNFVKGDVRMRFLIVEDDPVSRKLLQKFLSQYGECDMVIDGLEALDLFLIAHREKKPYNLICLDIMIPRLDGMKVLKTIRNIEKEKRISEDLKVKIIMTTALNDKEIVLDSYEIGCDAYAWKPIDMKKLKEVLFKLELIDKEHME